MDTFSSDTSRWLSDHHGVYAEFGFDPVELPVEEIDSDHLYVAFQENLEVATQNVDKEMRRRWIFFRVVLVAYVCAWYFLDVMYPLGIVLVGVVEMAIQYKLSQEYLVYTRINY